MHILLFWWSVVTFGTLSCFLVLMVGSVCRHLLSNSHLQDFCQYFMNLTAVDGETQLSAPAPSTQSTHPNLQRQTTLQCYQVTRLPLIEISSWEISAWTNFH